MIFHHPHSTQHDRVFPGDMYFLEHHERWTTGYGAMESG
jgi:hypothetical protein